MNHGEQCYGGLPGPHIPLQQPGHRPGPGHVGLDVRQDPFLASGQGKTEARQHGLFQFPPSCDDFCYFRLRCLAPHGHS